MHAQITGLRSRLRRPARRGRATSPWRALPTADWLPLACDPAIHAKHELAKRYEVAFVGNVFPGPRSELLEVIRRRYLRTFIGQRYFEEMARTYSAARIVFNRSISNDVNMRVFEAMACGSLLLDQRSELPTARPSCFGTACTWRLIATREDLLDKLSFYLERESLRERIAAAGLRGGARKAYLSASDGAAAA